MSSTTELARREERAQGGIIQFAEELKAIRDTPLYPGAEQDSGNVKAAWKSYCKERWGMSKGVVDETIQALPVLRRLASSAGTRQLPSVSAASRVASLPEPVQDVILTESPRRDEASDKATAARKAKERIEQNEGREATVAELIAAVEDFTPAKPKRKTRKMKDSKFISLFSQGYSFVEDAADYAQSNILSDTENDWGWDRVEKLRLQADRIADRLEKPGHVRDWNEEAAVLLGGDES